MPDPRWPDFFIVGAAKAGTSSLYGYLRQFPGIYMSPVKEPNFFSAATVPDDRRWSPVRDKRAYLALFAKAPEGSLTGEASAAYLDDPDAPVLIVSANPDAKIVISLRNPVDRLYSMYLMDVRTGRLRGDFHSELQRSLANRGRDTDEQGRPVLYIGFYAENVLRYLSTFGEQQVKVLVFEDLIRDTEGTVAGVLEFLGVKGGETALRREVYNRGGVPRGGLAAAVYRSPATRRVAEKLLPPPARNWLKERLLLKREAPPAMADEARAVLTDLYREDVTQLETILDRPLPWRGFAAPLREN
jgi:hypothetical protein